MEFLDEFQGWELFSKTVFGEESCPLELVEIGKEIVANCRGLPLSIVLVGGLLRKMEPTQGSWGSIRKNLALVVNLENDKHCLRLLKLSYNHLPVYLKPCFLYMGVFEEDNVIRVSKLIRLWVSEGFIKPVTGKSLETVAKGFLKDLVDRNLIQIDKLGSTGNIKWCRIHDLMRDLCLRESSKYGFYDVIGQEGVNRQRRVVILRNSSKQMAIDSLQSMSYNARSIICEQGEVLWCRNFRLLKRLNVLTRSSVDALVFECVNLRHLDIHAVRSFPSLHSSVNRFWNLHTFIVYCWDEWNAPVAIWKMPQLRHVKLLYGDGFWLADPPSDEQVHVMENLHTLKGVKNFKCDEEVVKRIPNMRKLRIKYYGREQIDYGLSNMECLCILESLNIYCDYEFRGVASLCKLTLPQSLKSFESLDGK
ncbi:putative late blight resistance protein homolog R1B-23 isoform X1 [Salvia hispanica]|uniref:putative late blight resistance protein homolog R1B-23 isoform X1 n=1 Tax=Salvia hispanica TaxID=49212 RepID=UPI0020093AF2|nr:putative late blight resistance protein homolog R1B-23 isoform X1 [Salvia hispanica]